MRTLFLVGLLGLFMMVETSSGVVLKKSIDELTNESTLIVKGQVVGKESYWNDAHNQIWSSIRVRISEYLKGEGGSEISLRVPGGTVRDTTLHVSDAAPFEVGEEVLLFLNPSSYYPVVGWFQGKYRIQGNQAINEIDPERSMPLDEMVSRIKRTLKE